MVGLALVIAVCIGIPCVIFYVYLRHWIFAVLALCPPVAVSTVAILIGPYGASRAIIAAAFGTICALSLGDMIVRGVCAGLVRRTIVSNALLSILFAVGTLFAAYLLSLCADAFILRALYWSATDALLFGAGFSVALVGAWLCSFFPFSEQFIARANSAREWRERTLERWFPVIQTRWAFSVSGIAMVLGAVAAFGIRDTHVHWTAQNAMCFPVGLFFVLAGFLAVTRDWRMALALTLAILLNETLFLWAYVGKFFYIDPITTAEMAMILSVPLSVMAAHAARRIREGDDISSSLAVAVREDGAVAIALGALASVQGLIISSGAVAPESIFAVASMFAALLLFPALTIAIYTLLPRYRTADEVFGKR